MADPVDETAETGTPPQPPGEDAAATGSDGADEPRDEQRIERHTTERRTLSPSVQLLWAVRVLFGLAVLGVVGGFAISQTRFDPRIAPVVVGALAVLGLVWVHLRYRIWSFRVREDALYLERGVITNVKTVAPHVRIQHVDTARGPLERTLGLSTLVVYTAGSRGADVSIPGLTTEEAADLQARVKELAIAADGGDAL
jgi:membrane protein YdbS with pleckstrin-like domain